MLEALVSLMFDLVLSAVGTVIARLCGADNTAEAATVIIGISLLALGIVVSVWGL
jgi:hypothetical protein